MRGQIYRRGKTWSFRVDVGADTQENRSQLNRGGFASPREAERELREVLAKLDRDRYVHASRLTVKEFLTEHWLPAVAGSIRPTTHHGYSQEIKLKLVPTIGHLHVQKLNAMHLNRLYGELLTNGREDGSGGLSVRSVRDVHMIIRKALADGVRWGVVERNVAELADPPKLRGARDMAITTWTPEESRAFLEFVKDERLAAAWTLLVTTGMRRGELLGLPWESVDLERRTLAVRQALVMVKGVPTFSDPKTPRSRRLIDLDAHTVAVLARWRDHQLAERDLWGEVWRDTGLVFTREDGSAVNPDGWSGTFEKRIHDSGLPRIRLHDLRHTHATQMLAAGVNPKIVSERLGHHSVAFTLDTYAHVIPVHAARRG